MAWPPDLVATDIAYRSALDTATSGSNPNATEPGAGKLWLPIWAGEVIHAYDEYNMFEPMVTHRTIASGRSMEFPITGTVDLVPQWVPGVELHGGQDSAATTFNVHLDSRPMAAHFELDNVDLMITQWEYRAELARQTGLRLANTRDKQIAVYIARAALEEQIASDPRPSGLDGQLYNESILYPLGRSVGDAWGAKQVAILANGGVNLTADDITNAALKLLELIEEFCVHLQEINAPAEGIYCCVTPRAFQQIRALGVARDPGDGSNVPFTARPYFGGVAESGGLGTGLNTGFNALTDSLSYMGVTIIKSNHMPVVDYSLATGTPIGEARYNLNFGVAQAEPGVKALMWQQPCVAALSLQGLKVDTVDDIRRNSVFTVASMMAGTGVIRPELACLVTDSSSAAGTPGIEATRAEVRTALGLGYSAEYVENLAGETPVIDQDTEA